MHIKLWGTRGSLPRAMTAESMAAFIDSLGATAKAKGLKTIDEMLEAMHQGKLDNPLHFGGNTTCSEITHKKRSVYVDMGSGLHDAGVAAMAEGRKEFTIFLTHLHWDHLMGMNFFTPIYVPRNKITIYHVHKHTPQHVQLLFNGINFPVKWEDLGATVTFRHVKIYQPVELDGIKATPFALDHPGGSFGWRFEADGKSAVIGVDGEYKRLTPEELGKDLKFYQNLDLLVFDAQYEMDELASRYDWGHCSPPIGVDLALREGIRNLVFTHHDPRAPEKKARAMFAAAQKHLKSQLPTYQKIWDKRKQVGGPNLYSAFDGMVLDLDKL